MLVWCGVCGVCVYMWCVVCVCTCGVLCGVGGFNTVLSRSVFGHIAEPLHQCTVH